jgi:hypothetical protein
MQSLISYLFEGGASGHMAHPYDYSDFTLRDLKGLIRNLFMGRIEDITEKIDGTNIQATMNNRGTVVFIRNKKDLNSDIGGMTITDMADKWTDKPHIAQTFLTAGDTITKVFERIGPEFFNPSPNKRIIVNCECVIEGKTNIIYYNNSQVDFHNIWVYEKDDNGRWINTEVTKNGIEVIEKACSTNEHAKITPNIIIRTQKDAEKIIVEYIKRLDRIFKDAGCREQSTIDNYKYERFIKECETNGYFDTALISDNTAMHILYNRWFNYDKSINIKKICDRYSRHASTIRDIEKISQHIVKRVIRPLDAFFISLGNAILDLCDNILNAENKDVVIKKLRDDLEKAVRLIQDGNDNKAKDQLLFQLERLKGEKLNPTEGIVFRYKGKLMKCTGSFGPLNAILGIQYRS